MRFRKKPVMESSYIVSGPGPHAAFIKSRIPAWVKHSAVADIKRLKPGLFPAHASEAGAADGLGRAPRWLRQALLDSQFQFDANASASFATMGSGHLQAQYIAQVNPMKLSSVEALWETEDPAPFAIVADIDEDMHKNNFELTVPGAFSFMLYNTPTGAVPGINQIQKDYSEKYGPDEYRPDVTGLFWSFRIMIGLGGLMILLGLAAAYFGFTDRPLACPCYLKVLPWLLPLPYLANSVGWYVAEAGRQPWIVFGLQKTSSAVSPNLTGADVWLTMAGFTVLYLVLAIAALWIAMRFIKKTQISFEEGRDA